MKTIFILSLLIFLNVGCKDSDSKSTATENLACSGTNETKTRFKDVAEFNDDCTIKFKSCSAEGTYFITEPFFIVTITKDFLEGENCAGDTYVGFMCENQEDYTLKCGDVIDFM